MHLRRFGSAASSTAAAAAVEEEPLGGAVCCCRLAVRSSTVFDIVVKRSVELSFMFMLKKMAR